jgi:EmrB/QacA subfamily drug resistance transporter
MDRGSHSYFNPWLALVVVCLGQFMVVLDATIVNVALPSIQADLHISDDSLQWLVNAYALLFGGFLLLGGRAADLIGRRTLFVAGVVLFSTASLANALAGSEGMLIAGRGIQGLGGALLSPAALAVITTSFEEGSERTKALSVWAAIASGGSAAGLLLGGVLVDALSWEWIFFVNVPIGVGIVFAALRLVPNSRVTAAKRHFDVAGAVSVTAGLVLLVYAIVKAPAWGWGSASTLGLGALAAALLGSFIAIELRSPAPLVRLGLFRLRSLAIANGTFLIIVGGLFAMFFFASLYLQNILHYSPLTTGLAFLPVTAGIMIGATIAQQLIQRIGVRPVMLTGMTVAAAGLAVLVATTKVDGGYLGVLGGLLPMSIGMGATFVPMTLVATTNVDADDAGLASGIFNTAQQVGGALGLAVLSTLATNRSTNFLAHLGVAPTQAQQQAAQVEGFQLAFIAAAVLMALGVVIVGVLLRHRDVERIEAGDAVPAADKEPRALGRAERLRHRV